MTVPFLLRPLPELSSVTPRNIGINLFSVRLKGSGDEPAYLVLEAYPLIQGHLP